MTTRRDGPSSVESLLHSHIIVSLFPDDLLYVLWIDILLSGCIPVLFSLETIYNQYPWHIGEELALDITVYIPPAPYKAGA